MRCLSLLLLLAGPLAAQTTAPADTAFMPLSEAVARTLARNYDIRIANTQTEAARNDNTRGNAGMLPAVSASVQPNGFLNNSNQEFFNNVRAPLVQSGIFNRNLQANVTLGWTIFDGMSMFITKQRLEELVRAGEANARVVVETTVAEVSRAYYDIVRQRQRVRSLRNALEISRQRRQLARDRYEVGQGSKLLYLNAQVDFNADTAALIAQQVEARNARVYLNQLMNVPPEMLYKVPDTIILARRLVYESLRDRTLQQNPQVQLAATRLRIAELDVRNQKALQFPQVDLLSGYTFTNLRNGGSGFGVQKGTTGSLNFGLRGGVNIFDGFNQRRRIQGARIQQEIITQEKGQTELELESLLNRQYFTYRNNLDLLDLEGQNLKVALQNVDIAFERYRVGVATPLELREAQRNLVATETRLIEAEYNAKAAEIELLRISSGLLK